MVFDERAYSVLVVSSGSRFNDAITPLLPYSEYYPVCFAGNIAAARREMLARAYDFVIINAPVCDDPGARFAMDISTKTDAIVLLLLKTDLYEQIHGQVQPYGVFTLPRTSAQNPGEGIDGGRQNGGDPPGESGQVGSDRTAENDRIGSPPLH